MLKSKIDKLAASIFIAILIFIAFMISRDISTQNRIENTCSPTDLYTSAAKMIYDCSGVGMEDLQ